MSKCEKASLKDFTLVNDFMDLLQVFIRIIIMNLCMNEIN